MGRFTAIPQDTFEGMQIDAGVLLRNFNPAHPVAPADEDIICATTGGIKATCTPEFTDLGEDVDNCPVNMKELKVLKGWTCTLEFTSLGTSPAGIKLALGCADIDGSDSTKIVPRKDLKQTDFSDVWWVGDRADGGFVAVQLKNALSTGGFSLQTSKAGKGNTSVTLTGHVSINAQNEMPMKFYSSDVLGAVDEFVGDGTTTAFTLSHAPIADGIDVYVDGTKLASTDFTVTTTSGVTTLTITTAPTAGKAVKANYIYAEG